MFYPWYKPQSVSLVIPHPVEPDSSDDEDFSFVVPSTLRTKLFCLVEKQDIKEIKRFFTAYPHTINKMVTANGWTPFMFAARYCNLELMEYFASIGMNPDISSQSILKSSIIHAAMYSKDIRSLKFVLDRLKCSPNVRCSQGPPLKVAFMANNQQFIELLISRGAFYIYKNVLNNISPIPLLPIIEPHRENYHFTSVLTNAPVHQDCIIVDSAVKPCLVKAFIQWARVRPLMHLRSYAKTQHKRSKNHPFRSMAHILSHNDFYNLIITVCVGDGSSLLADRQVSMNLPYSEQQGQS